MAGGGQRHARGRDPGGNLVSAIHSAGPPPNCFDKGLPVRTWHLRGLPAKIRGPYQDKSDRAGHDGLRFFYAVFPLRITARAKALPSRLSVELAGGGGGDLPAVGRWELVVVATTAPVWPAAGHCGGARVAVREDVILLHPLFLS